MSNDKPLEPCIECGAPATRTTTRTLTKDGEPIRDVTFPICDDCDSEAGAWTKVIFDALRGPVILCLLSLVTAANIGATEPHLIDGKFRTEQDKLSFWQSQKRAEQRKQLARDLRQQQLAATPRHRGMYVVSYRINPYVKTAATQADAFRNQPTYQPRIRRRARIRADIRTRYGSVSVSY